MHVTPRWYSKSSFRPRVRCFRNFRVENSCYEKSNMSGGTVFFGNFFILDKSEIKFLNRNELPPCLSSECRSNRDGLKWAKNDSLASIEKLEDTIALESFS